ncbi:hypothetical protein PAJ_0461 [Pantoea ananatis AJ13355]|uniref:Uncharacterized protein n=1 Tax=Pantoea ananatis (strain AJ13355) TaxID=932677 RepID=A0A0H3L1D4_PANAA|nr:hypothetical protein PAJ_0461 [Pantoea ananatis AJ13355]
MVENICNVLCLIRRTWLNDATFGLNVDRLTIVRHAFRRLFQHPALFNRQVNLFRLNIRDLPAHWRSIDIERFQDINRGIHTQHPTNQFKLVVTAINLNAETTFQLFHIIVERTTQAHQTAVISRFKGDFTGFNIQTNPLGHSGPVERVCCCIKRVKRMHRNEIIYAVAPGRKLVK